MSKDKLSRRDFVRNTSLVAAGTVAGALTGKGHAGSIVHTSKILNFHPKMTYRRLGKTNLMVSARAAKTGIEVLNFGSFQCRPVAGDE